VCVVQCETSKCNWFLFSPLSFFRFSPSVPKEIAMSYEPPAIIRDEESACNLSDSEAYRNLYPEKNFDGEGTFVKSE